MLCDCGEVLEFHRVLYCVLVYMCVSLQSLVFVAVAVDGHAAVVRDRPQHGRHSRDDACGRVVTHDAVRGFARFPSASKDEDLAVAHRHATALLHRERLTLDVTAN